MKFKAVHTNYKMYDYDQKGLTAAIEGMGRTWEKITDRLDDMPYLMQDVLSVAVKPAVTDFRIPESMKIRTVWDGGHCQQGMDIFMGDLYGVFTSLTFHRVFLYESIDSPTRGKAWGELLPPEVKIIRPFLAHARYCHKRYHWLNW